MAMTLFYSHYLNDLEILEKSSDKVHKLKGGVQSIPANNSGSDDIGGFRRCFSSDKFNGFCICDY